MHSKEALEIITNALNKYKVVKELNSFNILHMYDTKRDCINDMNGFYDSRYFRVWCFNTNTFEKCNMGIHDGIDIIDDNINIHIIKIFLDGATLIKFREFVSCINTQALLIVKIRE